MRTGEHLKKEVIVLSMLIGACVCILFSSPVFSDQVITIEDTGNSFPVYDSVQYQIQDTIQKEGTEGRRLFISRPFGYLECTEDSQVNLPSGRHTSTGWPEIKPI